MSHPSDPYDDARAIEDYEDWASGRWATDAEQDAEADAHYGRALAMSDAVIDEYERRTKR